MRALLLWLPLIIAVGCGNDVSQNVATEDPAPAAPSRQGEGVITAANPYAVEAGMSMLSQGGSAVDAAIAAHAVLGLVEPQSSGLGGGGFMLAYDAQDKSVIAIDGRETAPASAEPGMFLDEDAAELGFIARVQSGHAIGVPGAVALYARAHEKFGVLPWSELFAPAIRLADEGFEVSPRLHDLLKRISRFTRLDENPTTAAYFFPGGEPLAVGALRRNPDYADTLRKVAEDGPAGFYRGAVAEAIMDAAAEEPRPSVIAQADFDSYEAVIRQPVCGPYRGYRVCSMPPPSSGAALVAMLGLLERLTPEGMTDTVAGWSAFVDAMKLGYADRDHYMADADFVPVPIADLIDPAYLDVRVRARPPAAEDAVPGDPGAVLHDDPIIDRWGRADSGGDSGTSHLSVIDSRGNAVAFTASVEFAFGSQRMAAGFILNNELTDFAATPSVEGVPVANAAAAAKRPRSSMTPVLVFDADGNLFMATGSPGGNSIIAYTLKSLVGVIDLGLDAQSAVALPNIIARGLPVQIEQERAQPELLAGLRELGYPLDESGGENSGLHALVVRADHIEGAADPRREGKVGRVAAGTSGSGLR